MRIFTRLCTSLDGCIAGADGLPVQLSLPSWDAAALGFYELQGRCHGVLMGRTTFEPALAAPTWPWGDLAVYVLGSHRPAGTPEHVVFSHDPGQLLERVQGASQGRDIHLVGGPTTVETIRGLGALDEFRLVVLPMISGDGRRLTPNISSETSLALADVRNWPHGVVELIYRVGHPG